MKKNLLFLMVLGCLSITSISMKAQSEIDLSGQYAAGKSRSLIPPIQAFVIGQSIEADFNASLGTIVVSIYDEAGNAVYQQSVNTYAGQQIFIDITSFNPGEYTIEFVNSQNEYLSGEFEI